MSETPRQVLDRCDLMVCVGSGGVGKTSTAAAMGVWAAARGRKVMVLTIDPAKRLANSLGLQAFGNEGVKIDLSGIEGADPDGELWAMMLDTQRTFDNLVGQLAPNPETRERILSNPIYRTLSDTFAGSQEYMATEKLHDLASSGRYDLVVLDTPPVKNALDFLEAPGRLSRFFDKRVLGWFLTPYDEKKVFGSRLMMGTSAVIFRLLSYIFGREFLDDLSEFFLLWKDMTEEFRIRHERVLEMFLSQKTAFVTVCAPTEPSIEVARFFGEELARRRFPRGGVIVNQVYRCRDEPLDPEALMGDAVRELAADLGPRVAPQMLARLRAAHGRYRELVAVEQSHVEAVRSGMGPRDGFLVQVPRLEDEVNDISGLLEIGGHLFGE